MIELSYLQIFAIFMIGGLTSLLVLFGWIVHDERTGNE